MAAYSQAGTIAFKREQTEVYEIDRYYRYEITATSSGAIVGCVYLRKDEVDAADAVPDQITIDNS